MVKVASQFLTSIPQFDIQRTVHLVYSYNKSQQGALFLYFILVKNSTCFGQVYCPSLGV